MDLGLKDKVAVITGGSVGIGLAVARAFAMEGVHVAICARGKERVEKEAKAIADEFKVKTMGIVADMSKAEDIARMMADVDKKFDGMNFLINNAGTGTNEKIMDAPDEKWTQHWDLHVMQAVRTTRAAVPLMKKRKGGVILNTASVCAKQPLDYEPIYNTTKAALSMFGKCASYEFIPDNIRVNTICPGLILTPDWRKTAGQLVAGTSQTVDQYLDGVAAKYAPIKRFGSPEELANFYVFLCSDRAGYCVGATYYVDGGMINVVY